LIASGLVVAADGAAACSAGAESAGKPSAVPGHEIPRKLLEGNR
jgi:hypothetical protein